MTISSYDEIRLNEKLYLILTGTKKDRKVCSCRNKPGRRHKTTYYCDFINDHTRKDTQLKITKLYFQMIKYRQHIKVQRFRKLIFT